MNSLTAKDKRIIFWIIAIAMVMRLALAFRPEARLASRPYIEDAFYVFNTAYHLAQGNGLSADGVHQTNGIQPLIAFLYVPFFAIAGEDKWLATRLIFILLALLDALAIWLMAPLMRRISLVDHEVPWWQRPWIVAPLIVAFAYPVYWHHLNGLETGLYALLIIASLLAYSGMRMREEPPTFARSIALGALLGLTVLARIDAVFLVGGVMLTELWRHKQRGIAQMIALGAMAVVVSSPWWLYNYLEFGSFMPISGQSQQIFDSLQENLIRAGAVLADIGSIFFYLPYYKLHPWLLAVWVVFIGMLIYQLTARIRLWKILPERAYAGVLTPLMIASGCIFAYYVFNFGAPHFLPRYFHPIRLLWVMLVALSLPLIGPSIVASYKERKGLFLGVAIPVALFVLFFNANRYWTNYTTNNISELYGVGKWALQHPDTRVGMYQSGTASFVAPNVVNLDGKVNPDALHARVSDSIGHYIVSERLEYLADWKQYVTELAAHAERFGVRYELHDSVLPMYIYRRVEE
jgi:hypothetical protein